MRMLKASCARGHYCRPPKWPWPRLTSDPSLRCNVNKTRSAARTLTRTRMLGQCKCKCAFIESCHNANFAIIAGATSDDKVGITIIQFDTIEDSNTLWAFSTSDIPYSFHIGHQSCLGSWQANYSTRVWVSKAPSLISPLWEMLI